MNVKWFVITKCTKYINDIICKCLFNFNPLVSWPFNGCDFAVRSHVKYEQNNVKHIKPNILPFEIRHGSGNGPDICLVVFFHYVFLFIGKKRKILKGTQSLIIPCCDILNYLRFRVFVTWSGWSWQLCACLRMSAKGRRSTAKRFQWTRVYLKTIKG